MAHQIPAQLNRLCGDADVDARAAVAQGRRDASARIVPVGDDDRAVRIAHDALAWPELQALAGYRKALAAYHLAIADNLDWKGIKIEGLPKSAPPPMPDMAGTR